MSALGQKQTFRSAIVVSALPSKADKCGAAAHVCFGQTAGIGQILLGFGPKSDVY